MEYLDSFTKLSKAIAGTLLGGFLLQLAIPVSKQYLALVPGRTLPFIYTVLTSHLLEDQLVSAVAFAVGVLFLLRIIEPIYGSREVLRLLLYVLAATGATTFLLVFLAYLSTQTAKGGSLLYTEICGFHGGFAALLVAVKQVIPENEVALFGGVLRFRAKHLAGLYVALVVAMAALAGQALKLVPYAAFGAYYAWVYLRFWQHRGEGIRGDPAEDFRLASFFPQPAQPLVDKLGAPLAALMPRPGGLAAGAASGGGSSGSAGSGGGERGYRLGGAAGGGEESWDVARRRERGARALEERLGLKPGAAASLGNGSGSSQSLAASAEPAAGDDLEKGGNAV